MTHSNRIAAAVLAAIFLAIPAIASGRSTPAGSEGGDGTPVLAVLPLESPTILEIAARSHSYPVSLDIQREVRQARFERQRLESLQATSNAFRRLAAEHKQDLEATLANQKRIVGRVLSANADGFTIRARFTRKKVTIRYNEVSQWRVKPTAGSQALQTTVLVLITIPLLPFLFFGGLAGWQC